MNAHTQVVPIPALLVRSNARWTCRSRNAMSPFPVSALTIADDEITLDAEALAPKLGLLANTVTQSCLISWQRRHGCLRRM